MLFAEKILSLKFIKSFLMKQAGVPLGFGTIFSGLIVKL